MGGRRRVVKRRGLNGRSSRVFEGRLSATLYSGPGVELKKKTPPKKATKKKNNRDYLGAQTHPTTEHHT